MIACVRLVSFFVLVNGVSEGFFSSLRGLRQRRSILFCLSWLWKFMSRLIKRAVSEFISWFVMRNSEVSFIYCMLMI